MYLIQLVNDMSHVSLNYVHVDLDLEVTQCELTSSEECTTPEVMQAAIYLDMPVTCECDRSGMVVVLHVCLNFILTFSITPC